MNRFRIISLFIALSLLPPGNMPLPLEAATPTVTTDPAIITPGDAFSTRATGFAPDSTLNIFYEDQTEGAARHIIEGYFGEASKKTDETGTADFPGSAAVYDGGTTSFTFKDEAGNTAVGTVRVEGRAPRPFLFGPEVEVTEENIQIGFFGVGWTAGKEKSIRAFTPSDEAWTPQVFDLCENAACPEREDGLKLIAVLPRSLVPGTHRFVVSEQGTTEEVSTFAIIPELKENKAALMKEAFLFVQPQTASQYTEYLLIRGSGWGRYDDRGEPTVLLMPDNDTAQDIPLTLERNYRDCSFVVGEKIQGKCTMDEGDMFMRAPLPKNLKEGAYTVYVTTQNYFDGAAELRVVRLPDFSNAKRPIIAIQPTSGPVGTNVLLSAGGFPKRTGLFIRFDGAKQPGILYTDTNGAVGEYAFTIPSTISKDFKVTTIKPGKHTIEVTDGAGLFQTVTFTVIEKEEEPKKEVVEDPSKRFIGKPCDPVRNRRRKSLRRKSLRRK
ncbi:hypothetical protein HYV71_01370 [Candidatus Uhrbacteria bacterium]|nr:hypothetical protein [Candidatus Uhrbacteria bacterium]